MHRKVLPYLHALPILTTDSLLGALVGLGGAVVLTRYLLLTTALPTRTAYTYYSLPTLARMSASVAASFAKLEAPMAKPWK